MISKYEEICDSHKTVRFFWRMPICGRRDRQRLKCLHWNWATKPGMTDRQKTKNKTKKYFDILPIHIQSRGDFWIDPKSWYCERKVIVCKGEKQATEQLGAGVVGPSWGWVGSGSLLHPLWSLVTPWTSWWPQNYFTLEAGSIWLSWVSPETVMASLLYLDSLSLCCK